MGNGLDHHQVFRLQTRETIRAYVRELAGWNEREAQGALLAAVELIERAKHDPELADNLLAAEPANLDALINGAPTKKPVESGSSEEDDD
jgi:hypothetical protein